MTHRGSNESKLTRLAPAKLNLALSVGPPRADGMHPICSWMMTVTLFDELLLTRLEEDRFSRYAILWHPEAKRTSDIDWSITSDLAVRAHLALEHRVGRRLPVQLKLEKRIPVGGGLGGGSSNAAAMLLGLNELFSLELELDDLAAVGATLGSDIPFLIYGGSAIVSGFGERIERHPSAAQLHAVLAFPDAQCPTGRVYRVFDEMASLGTPSLREDAVQNLAASCRNGGGPRPDALFNDLARAAIRTAPELDDAIAQISALAERPAHVTGSGASLFIVCDDALHAEALASAIERKLNIPAVAVETHSPGNEAAIKTSAATNRD